jgi:hypothetical protein
MRLLVKTIIAFLFLHLHSVTFTTAQAAETRDDRNRFYLGLNAGSYEDSEDEKAPGGTFLAGYDLYKFFAVETHLGLAYESDEESDGINTISTETLLSHASVYIRGNLRLDSFTLFAVGGYTYMRIEHKIELNVPSLGLFDSIDESEDFDDVSYGGGIDLYGNATTAMTFKWMRIIDMGEEGEIDAWYIGFTHYLD